MWDLNNGPLCLRRKAGRLTESFTSSSVGMAYSKTVAEDAQGSWVEALGQDSVSLAYVPVSSEHLSLVSACF